MVCTPMPDRAVDAVKHTPARTHTKSRGCQNQHSDASPQLRPERAAQPTRVPFPREKTWESKSGTKKDHYHGRIKRGTKTRCTSFLAQSDVMMG